MFLPRFHFVSLKVALEVSRQSWRFLEASCVSLGKNYSFTAPKQESHGQSLVQAGALRRRGHLLATI